MNIKAKIIRNAFSLQCVRWLRRKTNNDFIRTVFQVMLSPIGEMKYLFSRKADNSKRIYKLGVVAIVKNEARFMEEWVLFHLNQGVDKIIIYDNGSTDDIRSVLKPYIKRKAVKYIYYPGKKLQCDVYNDAIYRYGRFFKYMIMLDADEFLYPSETHEKLTDIIDEAFERDEKVGCLVVNWLCYGSGGFIKSPEGHVVENYLKRGAYEFEGNRNYKTIVDPQKVFSYICPHFPELKKGYKKVNTVGDVIDTSVTSGNYERLRINHYFTKSKEDYIKKMIRGKADRSDKRGMDEFYRYDVNDIYDDSILYYFKTNEDK